MKSAFQGAGIKVLITGASGGLAFAVIPLLKKRGDSLILTGARAPQDPPKNFHVLDVSDQAAVLIICKDHRPGLILHLAAATDVDRCEAEPEWSRRVNALGTENIALACRERDIPMVYVSTAEVFDGSKTAPYTESDIPNPLNVYAKSKLEGEQAVQRILKKYFIVRTAWLVSGGKSDKKFVGKILRLMETEREILAVEDKIGSPTFADDLAKNMVALAESGRYGLYHMVNQGFCSRYEMALAIVKIMGRSDVKVLPASSKDFPLRARRGRSEALENLKLKELGLDFMPPWRESLKRYLKGL